MEALSISYKRYFSYTIRSLRAWLRFRSDQQVAHQGEEIIFPMTHCSLCFSPVLSDRRYALGFHGAPGPHPC